MRPFENTEINIINHYWGYRYSLCVCEKEERQKGKGEEGHVWCSDRGHVTVYLDATALCD